MWLIGGWGPSLKGLAWPENSFHGQAAVAGGPGDGTRVVGGEAIAGRVLAMPGDTEHIVLPRLFDLFLGVVRVLPLRRSCLGYRI
jgi:hypothetical protein